MITSKIHEEAEKVEKVESLQHSQSSDFANGRRSDDRIKKELSAHLFLKDKTSKNEHIVTAKSKEISLSGLSILSDKKLQDSYSEALEIQINFADGMVEGKGTIIWRNHEHHCYGIKLQIAEQYEGVWDKLLLSVEKPLPDRRQIIKRREKSEHVTTSARVVQMQPREKTRRIVDFIDQKNATSSLQTAPSSIDLFPKVKEQNYTREGAEEVRKWLEKKTGTHLEHSSFYSADPKNMKGNIENLFGVAQIPMGVAGPIRINGQFAKGDFYVPMATTEGTMVKAYHHGMRMITASGGVTTSVLKDEIHTSPLFQFSQMRDAELFVKWLNSNFSQIKEAAEKTTRYGKLIRLEPYIFDLNVVIKFCYTTGDAMGINIIMLSTKAACQYIVSIVKPKKFYLQGNFSSIKKVTAHNFVSGYGKAVIAESVVQKSLIKRFYKVTPEDVVSYFHAILLNTTHAGMVGMSGHVANALSAIFIACGQDAASVVESHVAIINYDITPEGDLYASVKLPNLVVGTVGGGTALPTQRECLELLDCYGVGNAKKFSEVIAASVLAGEVAICASNAAGSFSGSFTKKRKITASG
ncbi:MAG: hydroxymethylglutaryl-CoA reductase [Nitrospirota bacterium]